VAVAFSMAWRGADVDGDADPGGDDGDDLAPGRLAGFRRELSRCLGGRRDALFELDDAVLCWPGRVHMLAELSLEPECRRGHGAVYDALSCGEVRVGRIRLGVDVSPWLRPGGRHQPGPAVLPCLRPRQGPGADDPGLAVLGDRRACHARLRLARPLAADIRLPWQRPCPPGRLTPAPVRRDFRNIRATAGCPAGAPKPGKPGPGRPPGSKNRCPAPRHDVGKTTKRDLTLKARRERTG
jgi:hypothetical protein